MIAAALQTRTADKHPPLARHVSDAIQFKKPQSREPDWAPHVRAMIGAGRNTNSSHGALQRAESNELHRGARIRDTVDGKRVEGRATLVRFLEELRSSGALDEVWPQLPQKFSLDWANQTATLGSQISVRWPTTELEAKTALQVELRNMARQGQMGGFMLDLLLAEAAAEEPKMFQGVDTTDLDRKRAARAIATELEEMANCLDAFNRGDTQWVYFQEQAEVAVIPWIKHQIQTGHTGHYDASCQQLDWKGLEILEDLEGVQVKVSPEGVAALRQLAEKIGAQIRGK